MSLLPLLGIVCHTSHMQGKFVQLSYYVGGNQVYSQWQLQVVLDLRQVITVLKK